MNGDAPLTFASLFSGIGGIDLGLERAGMHVVWQAESDPWCRSILARHWPGVPCYRDVRSILGDADSASSDAHATPSAPRSATGEPGSGRVPVRVPRVDVLAGGFPCQPVSLAGKGLAQADERWLWPEFARLIRLLRPRYVIAENVPGLLARGLDIVLADLAALRFDAEWTVFGARDVGAPHKRDRVWIVAWDTNPDTDSAGRAREPQPHCSEGRVEGRQGQGRDRHNAHGLRLDAPDELAHANGSTGNATWSAGEAVHRPTKERRSGRRGGPLREPWPPEPDVGRVAHGIPNRVDRLRALGNAVVPACAEHIGRLVMEMHARG